MDRPTRPQELIGTDLLEARRTTERHENNNDTLLILDISVVRFPGAGQRPRALRRAEEGHPTTAAPVQSESRQTQPGAQTAQRRPHVLQLAAEPGREC